MTATAPATPPDGHVGLNQPLVRVRDLRVSYRGERGWLSAVDGVTLEVPRGGTLAIVGESGSGKSTLALALMGLLPAGRSRVEARQLELLGRELADLSQASWRPLRGRHVAMIFQEPSSALNPVLTIGQQVLEVLRLHRGSRGRAARRAAIELLGAVGITAPQARLRQYPHELSGGMCQRVMIAMALAGHPELLIADEPTTALDVTIQAQILELLRDLQRRRGLGILLITHDLGVAARAADAIGVMYAGRLVEIGPTAAVLRDPRHPYTAALLRCSPQPGLAVPALPAIPGQVPTIGNWPQGCRFHPRCELAARRGAAPDCRPRLQIPSAQGTLHVPERCASAAPPWLDVGVGHPGHDHRVACHEVCALPEPHGGGDPA